MKRLTLILAIAASPALAQPTTEEFIGKCAEFSGAVETIAEARGDYDSLVTAMQAIPDLPEVQAFGYERTFVQKVMLQVELLHDKMTPAEISEAMELWCVEKALRGE